MLEQPKILITGGCSYSQVPNRDISWPIHLQELPSIRYVAHTGHGSAGNQIISRKVISKVLEAIDAGHKTKDMLVGVMWSGCDRQSHYSPKRNHNWDRITVLGPAKEDYDAVLNTEVLPIIDLQDGTVETVEEKMRSQWQTSCNPLSIRNHKNPSHYIFNAHWNDDMTSHYFERFVNPDKAVIETCEHILRTQWFLKEKGIKYFFTEYDNDVFTYHGPHGYGHISDDHPGHNFRPGDDPFGKLYSKHSECIQYPGEFTREVHEKCINDPEINYLYNAIDKDYFLPIKHLGHWAKDISEFDFAREGDPHPSTEQHKDFTQQIILPFLLEKYNISSYNV